MNKKTAILIFANSAKKEAINKPFNKSAVLFEELNRQTLQKVIKSGLPYFLFSEERQHGTNFGERYTNAIQYIYNQGFENVITIGNDTPHLKTSQLIETAEKLNQNSMVLGPSEDGGYYLLGLNRSHFNKEAFLMLPWRTAQLAKQIYCLIAAQNGQMTLLETLTDIDAIADIKSILNSFRNIAFALKKILLSIFSSEKKIAIHLLAFLQNTSEEIHFNKGSPFFIPN